MKKIVESLAALLSVIAIGLIISVHFFYSVALLSVTIAITVFAYHFTMRLLVGRIVNLLFRNNININAAWFKEKPFEAKLYKVLRVKKWKRFVPTFAQDDYDVRKHSVKEIITTTCINEVIHEVIMGLSFLPILLIIPFGLAEVFVTTSFIAAFFDSIFVVLQRFNRPRLLKLLKHMS